MTSLIAKKRETKSKGAINKLRREGFVPAVLYGGAEKNQKISLKKDSIKSLINSENFLSNLLNLNIDGKEEKVIPRDISFHPLSDEPTHIDFLRIVKGKKIVLEIPVNFINADKSPGLKKGGVLNIVRRKVELNCPTENIPDQITVDLDNSEIGTSIKISSITLPENVEPTIKDRDFVIATVASPTIVVEPEKPAEEDVVEGAEGAEGVEGATPEDAAKEGAAKPGEESKDKSSQTAKPGEDKKEPSKKKEDGKKDTKTKK